MKAIQLLLMMLATALNPVFSQKQLPSSIQPYAVNWGYSVKSMFQAAGYDVPGPKAAFDLKPTIENRSDELRLDSTISYFGYDLNLQDSLPLFRNVHTYPQPDTEVVTEYYFAFDHWVPLSRTTMVSDDLGRLVDAFSMVYDETTGTYTPDSRIEFYPYGNSMTEADSFFVYGWAPELKDWHRLLAVWNRFDASGHLIESLSSTELFEFPILFLDRYFYNTDGDLASIESFNIDGDEEFPASRELIWYTDHLPELSIMEVYDGFNGYVAESKKTYAYTTFRKQELVKSFNKNPQTNDWELSQVLGFGYDEQQRVVVQEDVSADEFGRWIRQWKEYNYFQDENIASIADYTFDYEKDAWVLEEKTYYFYNELTAYEPVDPIAIEKLVMWPNPSSGQVSLKLEGAGSVDIYSNSGQFAGRYPLHPGQSTLNLSDLPAGIYEIKAKSEDAYYAGRLVLQGQ